MSNSFTRAEGATVDIRSSECTVRMLQHAGLDQFCRTLKMCHHPAVPRHVREMAACNSVLRSLSAEVRVLSKGTEEDHLVANALQTYLRDCNYTK